MLREWRGLNYYLLHFEVEFTDRDRGIRQIYEFSERGTRYPIVVFGPEGCGKTSWLKQITEVLKELGFEVIYVNPLHKEFITYTGVKEITKKFTDVITEVSTEIRLVMLATLVIKELLSKWWKRIALLVDDVFKLLMLIGLRSMLKKFLDLLSTHQLVMRVSSLL